MRTYARNPVEFVRGEGTRLWDADGNEYLDFLQPASRSRSIGHCHPALVEAVTSQAARLMHVGNLFYTEPVMRLAERLRGSSLGGKVFFANSGAEANECAHQARAQAPPRRRDRRARGRLPRPHVRARCRRRRRRPSRRRSRRSCRAS